MSLARFDLSGRRALITGASRGIGQAIACGLAEAGARVTLAARGSCAETAELIGGAQVITADVSREEDCARAVAEAADAMGGLDILVNNAGVEEVRPSTEADAALWHKIIDTNLKGAFFCATAAARRMSAGGSIINLLSLASERGIATAAPYTASKTGLLGLTRALAAEWGPRGIRVNGIAPGYFRTALTEPFYADESWRKEMLAKTPLGRFGEMEDLKGAAIFLASDASRYVSGIMLPVDGGTLAAL